MKPLLMTGGVFVLIATSALGQTLPASSTPPLAAKAAEPGIAKPVETSTKSGSALEFKGRRREGSFASAGSSRDSCGAKRSKGRRYRGGSLPAATLARADRTPNRRGGFRSRHHPGFFGSSRAELHTLSRTFASLS